MDPKFVLLFLLIGTIVGLSHRGKDKPAPARHPSRDQN
jgi:hypothetical protein